MGSTKTPKLTAPFPWFGGKRRVAGLVWERFGKVAHYVEPFAGSLAVLLGSPYVPRYETVNDADGFICNFWRAVQSAPEQVAAWCDWPINESDLHARHKWLRERRENVTAWLQNDPEYFDAKVAGWWVWGLSCWLGRGWCNEGSQWMTRPHLSGSYQGVRSNADTAARMLAIRNRLRRTRVCCGDWTRVCGPSPTFKLGLTGVFLDPPYKQHDRNGHLYSCESSSAADECREWAAANGDNPRLRIALCGYDGHYSMPDGWAMVRWKARGGYGSQSNGQALANAAREVVWFSPHCLSEKQGSLF